jgi:hypothetical protein
LTKKTHPFTCFFSLRKKKGDGRILLLNWQVKGKALGVIVTDVATNKEHVFLSLSKVADFLKISRYVISRWLSDLQKKAYL